jgi:hypothetical protein
MVDDTPLLPGLSPVADKAVVARMPGEANTCLGCRVAAAAHRRRLDRAQRLPWPSRLAFRVPLLPLLFRNPSDQACRNFTRVSLLRSGVTSSSAMQGMPSATEPVTIHAQNLTAISTSATASDVVLANRRSPCECSIGDSAHPVAPAKARSRKRSPSATNRTEAPAEC